MKCLFALGFFMTVSASQLQAANFVCDVMVTEKHFNQTKPQIFDGFLSEDEEIFTLSLARRKFKLNPNGTLAEPKFKIEVLEFSIVPSDPPNIVLSKKGPVNDGALPALPMGNGRLRFIKVRSDDIAFGILNSSTRELLVQTRFFHLPGIEYEYGWRISGHCELD